MNRSLIPILICLLAVGCTGFHVEFPKASDRAFDESAGRSISAEASGFQLLLWIPIGVNGRYHAAWEDLQGQAPDHYITDIMIQDSWIYCLVGTLYTVHLEAVAYPYVSL